MTSLKLRQKEISKVLVITLGLNLFVAIIKLLAGMQFNYLSLTSSGLESMMDGSTNILALLTIFFASKPADEDHNYGHYKAETLGSLVVALMLLFSAYQMSTQIQITEFFSGNFESKAQFSWIAVVSIAISMGVSLFVSWYEGRKGRELKSSILEADASHTFGDFIISGAVLISIIATKFEVYFLDTFVGLLVTAYLVFLALKIVKLNINELLDAAPDLSQDFIEEIEKMDNVYDIHNFRCRGNEHWIQADFHVHLNPNLTLKEAHKVGKVVEDRVKSHLEKAAQNVDVLVHIEPWHEDDNE